jgi:hypothetical protein
LGSEERPVRKAETLTAIDESIVKKMWQCPSLTTLLASTACYKDSASRYSSICRMRRLLHVHQRKIYHGLISRKKERLSLYQSGHDWDLVLHPLLGLPH